MSKVRLKKGDKSLIYMYQVSLDYYKYIDDKIARSKLDVIGAKITARKNMTYNTSTHLWEQEKGKREIKFTFMVSTRPESYKKQDTVDTHKYPVIFLIRDLEAGINSSFRSRVGGIKKWKTPKRRVSDMTSPEEKSIVRNANLRILNQNIKNGLQADFIFRCMWVWKHEGLLFGPMTCLNRPPKITNPSFFPYFSKHEYWIITWLLMPILQTKKNIIIDKFFKS